MSKTARATLAGLLGNSIFGFGFLFAKVAMENIAPFAMVAFRMTIAFLIMNALLLTGKVRISLKGKPVKLLLLMGLVHPVLYMICESYGLALTPASFSGLMIGMAPVAGLVMGRIFLKERCTTKQVICAILSVMGVMLTSFGGGMGVISLAGTLFLVGAVILYALYNVISRGISEYFTAFERTYMMFALGSVSFIVLALFECGGDVAGILFALEQPGVWTGILYLAVVSSVFGFMLVNYSLSYLSVARATLFSNVTTVISVLAGIFILHDQFSALQLVGVAVILASVCGVSYQKEPSAGRMTSKTKL